MKQQIPFVCLKCGQWITRYGSGSWNAQTCDRCLPDNPNPQLARLERMGKASVA